jgi:hypothetical protein
MIETKTNGWGSVVLPLLLGFLIAVGSVLFALYAMHSKFSDDPMLSAVVSFMCFVVPVGGIITGVAINEFSTRHTASVISNALAMRPAQTQQVIDVPFREVQPRATLLPRTTWNGSQTQSVSRIEVPIGDGKRVSVKEDSLRQLCAMNRFNRESVEIGNTQYTQLRNSMIADKFWIDDGSDGTRWVSDDARDEFISWINQWTK